MLTDMDDKQKDEQNVFNAWALAWDLGWQIAVPLVVFALLGRFADHYFDTSPWLLVAGVVLAAATSSYIVYRKVSRILK